MWISVIANEAQTARIHHGANAVDHVAAQSIRPLAAKRPSTRRPHASATIIGRRWSIAAAAMQQASHPHHGGHA